MGFASLFLPLDAWNAKAYHRHQDMCGRIYLAGGRMMEKDPNITITIRYNPQTDQVDITFPASLSPALLSQAAECMLAGARQTLLEHRQRLN